MANQNSGQKMSQSSEQASHSEVGAHHISSIAHLFFDEVESSNSEAKTANNRRFMVFSAGPSPVAAVAAAGLSMGSQGDYFKGRVVLRENDGLPWSASSFMQKSAINLLGPSGAGENEGNEGDHGSAWLVQSSVGAAAKLPSQFKSKGAVRWFHAGCADDTVLHEMESIFGSQKWGRDIPGAADGLVWCLLEKEAVSLIAAYQLGRLISLLQPNQVEILIFPDSWSKTGKPIWQRKLYQSRDNSASHQESLINRCRELAAAVGDCKVSLMPESLTSDSGNAGSSGGVLQMIASRMLAAD